VVDHVQWRRLACTACTALRSGTSCRTALKSRISIAAIEDTHAVVLTTCLTVPAIIRAPQVYDALSFVKIYYLRHVYPWAAAPAACPPTTRPAGAGTVDFVRLLTTMRGSDIAAVDTGLLSAYPSPESTPWHALAANSSGAASPMRVTLVTLCTAALGPLCAASIDNKQAYAQRHGYTLFVAPDEMIDPTRPVAWSKLQAMQAAMASGAHLVAWFDADALIMAPHVRLEDIMLHAAAGSEDAVQIMQVLASDHRGPNTGVWLVRSSPWAAALLQRMWELGDTYTAMRPGQSLFRYEQRALHFLFQSALWHDVMLRDSGSRQQHVYEHANGVRARTQLVHTCVLNSLPSWYRPGHFVLHLAGVKGTARCLLFRQAYERAAAAAGRVPGLDSVPQAPSIRQCFFAGTRWPTVG
jgi:hypothetical protein